MNSFSLPMTEPRQLELKNPNSSKRTENKQKRFFLEMVHSVFKYNSKSSNIMYLLNNYS